MILFAIILYISGKLAFFGMVTLDLPLPFAVYCVWDKLLILSLIITAGRTAPKKYHDPLKYCAFFAAIGVVAELYAQLSKGDINTAWYSGLMSLLMIVTITRKFLLKKWL